MAKNCDRKSAPSFREPKTTLRDATLKDLPRVESRIKYTTTKFFGPQEMIPSFRSADYSLIMEHENGKMCSYANFRNAPNISAVPDAFWLDWLQYHYKLPKINYGNTLFLTFFVFDDPYNTSIVRDLFTEIFLREPKLKYICTVCPPIDSIYEEVLEVYCQQIFSLEESVNRLCQSLFVCERYKIIPKMRLRRALAEDNDDLIEIIDEQLPAIRLELGDYYIAEEVMRNDPSETIIVAEISNATIGMIWINTNIHRKALADNFEISAYGNFLQPQKGADSVENRTVADVIRRASDSFFDKKRWGPMGEFKKEKSHYYDDNRMSLNNLYICSSESSDESNAEDADKSPKTLFEKWERIGKNLKNPRNYREEVRKIVKMPKTTEVTNAFAIQLFGLTKTIDARRIFDLVAAAFGSYPDKDYCMISLSSSEASSDSLSGPLLKYFSRVVPRPGCKISDCLYVTHRNSFLSQIDVDFLTYDDIVDIENMLCLTEFSIQSTYFLADIVQRMMEYLENPWSPYDVIVIRCAGVAIGFAVLQQNLVMIELRTNFAVYDGSDAFPDWKASELKYMHLHPVFVWEWVHVTREICRLTGYIAMYYRLIRQYNQPVLNSVLMNMFPVFPRKQAYRTHIDPYALYYLSVKMIHIKREHIENKIVIVGFNEVCKGFLRSLIFSSESKNIQCVNITVITDCPGFIEAEFDIKSFEKQDSAFFQAKNQFDAEYLRRLEFRTWVTFIGGRLRGIYGDKKRIILENGTSVRYDRLFLMCSSRYSAPKAVKVLPVNYFEINTRLDKIIFYNKIKLLLKEEEQSSLPILIYGVVVMAHSCVSTLIDLGVNPERITLVIPRITGEIDFPETFDDDYAMKFIYRAELNAGIKIYKNLKYVDWEIQASDNSIRSAVFESEFERITMQCLAFISFYGEAFPEKLRRTMQSHNIKIVAHKIVIDEYCKTSIPYVYAAGRITQYQEKLFAGQLEQTFFNQIEIGNQLASNYAHERCTGAERSMLEAELKKPIFRQSQLVDGMHYAGLRQPGRYVPRNIRKNLKGYGRDLVTCDDNGEYCRVCLNIDGFITEITCLSRKYSNLEVLYRIYGYHETIFNNLVIRYEMGEINSLVDYFFERSFTVLLHDRFYLLKDQMRSTHLNCVKEFLQSKKKIDRKEIQEYLKSKGMHELMQKQLINFIALHWKSLHPVYALPNDFPTN